MIRFFLLTLFLFASLHANKVIYLSYDEAPQRVLKGEIFSFTVKSLSTVKGFKDIRYKFSNLSGLKMLTTYPKRKKKGKYFYDTFYALSTKSRAKLPDINATLIASQDYNSSFIEGEKLNIVTLNPRKNFSEIIADEFELVEYKTTAFDKTHNIIVFVATAKNCNIDAMHFKNVLKQGKESSTPSYLDSKITYFLVIDKRIENFTFSYFSLKRNKFLTTTIPIVVEDDSVTTQSDIKPKDQSKERLKMSIAAAVAFVSFIFVIWRKRYIYLVFIVIPLIYIIYLAIPAEELCIKEGTQIHLLPVDNGTIFETTTQRKTLLKEGSVEKFVKVQLKNKRIGWVKNEDICSY